MVCGRGSWASKEGWISVVGMDRRLGEVVHDSRAQPHQDEGDRAVSAIAERQRGLITHRQLVSAGLGRGAIGHRIARGRLHPLYRGVYLVGHSLPVALAREQGALLACGGASALSHRSGGVLWRMPVQPPDWVELTLVGRARAQREGIRIYRVAALDPRDIRRHKGLTVTAPARTLLDLAAVIPPPKLEQAVAEALARHLASETALREAMDRAPKRHGTKALRALLDRKAAPAWTRSKSERLMLALVRRHRLPEPATNVQLEAWNVDFFWREQRLVVEVDSYGFHSSPASWERDHRKEADLEDSGLRLRRVTYRQLTDQPDRTAQRIKRWLAPNPAAPATS